MDFNECAVGANLGIYRRCYQLTKEPMKPFLPDIIVILVLTGLLLVLNELGQLEAVMSYPFLVVYGAYLVGRLVRRGK